MFQSGKSSETVNLMKAKRKKSEKCCGCADVEQQTNSSDKCPQNRDDTFSFTSCSLKKLLTMESPRIMMALIIVVATMTILLVLRCICCPAIITDFAQERRDRRSDDVKDDRKPWESSKLRLMSEFSELTGKDTKESSLHSGELEYPEYMLPELSSILDPIKVNEGYGSSSLREFYRKLLKTDIQIKNLKKGLTNIKHGNSLDFTGPNSPRLKRSLKIFTDLARLHDGPSASLNKRSLENNKYYLTDAWKVDNDGKVVQDDLDVDQPDLSSPLEKSVEKQKLMKQQKDPEYKITDKGDILSTHQPEDSAGKKALKHLQFNHHGLFNALFGRRNVRERPSTQHRRLLQHEDDEDKDEEESEDYEDQTKEPWDRQKRTVKTAKLNNDKLTETVKVVKLPKSAESVRKEPKPIYNNEINYMIEAAIRMATGKFDAMDDKENFPRAVIETNKEYFEDIGNYDDLVEMAQAYSDYGVLDSKKEIAEKNKAIGNTIHLLSTEKPPDVLEQIYKIGNSLRGQRVKLKSNSETNPEKENFLKKFKHKLFSKGANPKVKVDIVDTTAINVKTANSSRLYNYITSTPWNIFTQKKAAKKNKERNVMYSGHRRSLKSVEIEEPNDDAAAIDIDVEPNFNNRVNIEHNENNITTNIKVYTNNVDLDSINEYNKSDIVNETSQNKASVNYEDIANKLSEGVSNRNNTSWGLGELFGMFADFCMFLSGFDENQEENGYRFLYDFVIMLNPKYLQTKNKTTAENLNDTRAPIEVLTDSEMVDNIGHRSRVLMSFEEKAENSTPASIDKEHSSDSYVITTNKENTNATRENKITNSSNIESKDAVVAGNRTVVKRSANGNVIFWNDLYDDEYGIKDPMEDDLKDKSSVKFNDFMEKDNWISNKFKILAKNLKERKNRKMEAKKNKKLKNSRNNTKTPVKRSVPVSDVSGKQMFEGLTANMKRVCHEAAQAVHESTNREVRADSNQASTLMQQLVSLMSELVDLQVRAKTCVQLPEDLRSFLAWLTSPGSEERDDIGFSVNSYDSGPNNLHTPDTYELLATANARSECLGTIHDVEDLILQYDEMSEEDKSKMSGVREYLEHQLHYLHKQLSSYNEYGSPDMYRDQPIRRRRQPNSIKKQRRRKTFKFLNYGRKHTRSTDFDDFGTEDYKSLNFGRHKDIIEYYKQDKMKNRLTNFENNDVDANEKGNRNNENGLRRNLREDYYSDLVKNNDTIFKHRT